MSVPDLGRYWREAIPYAPFVAAAEKNRTLWETLHSAAHLPAWLGTIASPGPRRFLVITEDWCTDAASTIPVLARALEQVPDAELRLIGRDTHLELMDAYLTNGARSIPVVIVMDDTFRELGHWGPRPAELQAWSLANRLTMPGERFQLEKRKWYAKDRGESTVRELIRLAGYLTGE